MKTKLILIVIFITLVISSSKVKAQTSLEEYNYITKGYKVQIESGLDMKKGYEFVDIDKYGNEVRTAELKALYRIKDNNRIIACYLLEYQSKGYPKEYICIPNPNSEPDILKKYWDQLYDGSFTNVSNRLQFVTYLISRQMKW